MAEVRNKRITFHVGCLIAIFVCTVFGPGLQSVAALAWLFYPFLIHYGRNGTTRWPMWIVLAFVWALGSWVANMGALRVYDDEGSFGIESLEVLGYAAALVILMIPSVLVDKLAWKQWGEKYPLLTTLVFPAAYAGTWRVFFYAMPFGALGHVATTVYQWTDLLQLASVFGADGIAFLMAWSGPVVFHKLYSESQIKYDSVSDTMETLQEPQVKEQAKKSVNKAVQFIKTPIGVYFSSVFLVFLIGGFRISSWGTGGFFQKSISHTAPEYIDYGCVISDGTYRDATSLFARSQTLVNRGSRLILWSEEAVIMNTTVLETQLLQNTSKFAKANDIFIGVTYQVFLNQNQDSSRNMMAVYGPNGDQLILYQKTHPVPLAEPGVIPGPEGIPTVAVKNFTGHNPSTSLTLGTSICFDVTGFPQHDQYAAWNSVDIVLQPLGLGVRSRTKIILKCFTRCENGVTVFRCSSRGFSAVVNGFGVASYQKQTTADEDFVATVPVAKRIFSLFPFFGLAFGWVCLGRTVLVQSGWFGCVYLNGERSGMLP
ncbi:hypothetical protein BCR33DRAFT_848886 [Rhizoclosmatium globosum]|uniref:CN hydrolase domain-containing protein n=1 Tax=Rhizoclosmatium globosum TaxID=329046 RepID=A0A1Y2CKH4_9FUNG|nr:hypothetical protein BCR33DRAFT_848886 [Rhizoclosmatium globosum]|eukprot:ORY46835.1 hypothetical protein BCR33DRAFT_848886 [Rhizoclosmatium globosum]